MGTKFVYNYFVMAVFYCRAWLCSHWRYLLWCASCLLLPACAVLTAQVIAVSDPAAINRCESLQYVFIIHEGDQIWRFSRKKSFLLEGKGRGELSGMLITFFGRLAIQLQLSSSSSIGRWVQKRAARYALPFYAVLLLVMAVGMVIHKSYGDPCCELLEQRLLLTRRLQIRLHPSVSESHLRLLVRAAALHVRYDLLFAGALGGVIRYDQLIATAVCVCCCRSAPS